MSQARELVRLVAAARYLMRQEAQEKNGDGERLLNAREVGELLGVATGTVLDRWEAGELPGFKLWNGPVRFRASEIEAALEAWRRGPTPTGKGTDGWQ